jgi:hypothetical protein
VTQVLKRGDGLVALKVPGSRPHRFAVEVRADDGRVLWSNDWADGVALLRDTLVACVKDRLVRYSWPELAVIDEAAAPELAENLIPSPSGRLLVVHQNDGQGMNGYQVFSLDGPLRRVSDHIGLNEEPMYAMPVFSASERFVASAPGNNVFWVPPYDDWPQEYGEEAEIPSNGGLTKFADLLVHDLRADVVTRHELQFDLAAGWVPEDCFDGRWTYGPIDLDFPADDRLRVRLPDGAWVDVSVPLPDKVLLPIPDRVLSALH